LTYAHYYEKTFPLRTKNMLWGGGLLGYDVNKGLLFHSLQCCILRQFKIHIKPIKASLTSEVVSVKIFDISAMFPSELFN
jgi:hypothetical protein